MSSNTPTNKKTELPNEVRVLLAFVLMGLILLATPWVYRQLGIAPPPQPAKKSVTQTSPPPSAAPAVPPETKPAPAAKPETASAAGPTASAPGPNVSAGSEQDQVLDTDLYHVVLSNRGAVVKSWTLKSYKDRAGKPLELVNQPGAQKDGYPFSFVFRDKHPSVDLNKVLWAVHSAPGGLAIQFEFSDGQSSAKKSFRFQRDGYMVQYADDVTVNGTGVSHLVEWRGGFGDMAVHNPPGQQATVHYDAEKQKLIRDAAKTAKNGPVNADGAFSFAGIDDEYFAAAFLPPANTPIETTTYDDLVPSSFDPADQPFPGVAVGGLARNELELYVGPKELNTLKRVNPKLEGIVNWGFFGVVAKPLFLILHWMNDQFVHNYGWSIILLTILINMALFPLKLTNLKSMRKMQALQPELNKINQKYKGISMKDARATNKQQEMMDLYKKHGVNPMGGCLPMLVQLPFLYAFYTVLAVSIEMRNASWLWVGDLSQPEHLPIHLLPLIMVVTSFIMQRMTPASPGVDPNQQRMMQFMPLMYLFFFYSLSSGLVLYWLTSNLVGIAQQWFFNKTSLPATAPAVAARESRKRT